ncbi:ribosomal protein L33 (chloroplast) [Klebsormidium nitens]|uniref:Large ribosomal subunit protein bL33c n=3 Tax=Klebsormidium TaxID=3174 RepID=A0A0U9HKV5_KLENI|nr:ribosomal protein L33 [Klebsormidium flaccidum]ANI26055.1 ribosomal protein L33 [Klebsormidium sp. SAG 51.86]WKT07632.1 ribosomal protein L33 [Klebsormidium nitens]AHZ10995.1 ribosomal protein L33 [Klebsormidium flaccidum]WKT06972.1 ribosomal protein L33 [Klebsormidium flaccidum]GAQ93744.1 ribosomal protein L33 [Klebsormidium nitens]|eukprot:GAQ93744.1 ribosomal protein L33 (chloroplast) [Klebsormidium nitens]
MAKAKGARVTVTLECTLCNENRSKRSAGISRYTTQKNRRSNPGRLELKKFCTHCNEHTPHREIKK